MAAFFREYRDILLAFTGIIIALLSLWFTWSQSQEQIKHNHISVEPRMNAYFSNDGRANKSGIYIINNGMGTAFVSAISATVNGKKVEPVAGNIFVGAVQALGLDIQCFVIGGPRPNDSFKVGEEIFLIEARGTDERCSGDSLILRSAALDSARLDFVLDIESIYGDRFRYVYSQNKQIKRD
ncbi:hypothetical protein [Klebsiella aerogenes]|uniref:hypothetical protein n=1 Tax=Klebsiella aerogenes TaxID=548 RepID=UPI002B27326D|nr:hypothetical protein [Klebsiella aerogenes]MEA8826945.1 hypothetical protein [Klebsiella aerogenes]HBR6978674.1 hypothetical protein [Klebsiella aerogenes]